jgi:predicted dienelactone hydrolase
MKRALLLAGWFIVIAPLWAADLPVEVAVTKFDWKDAARDREVPVTIYAPKASKDPLPVIVFSHGLGGTRDGYAYLGKHWASHGYVSVHLQHKGSDDAVWKGKADPLAEMRKAVKDRANALNRPVDVRFVIDQLTKLNREDPTFKGRLDLDRVGMAGHSFGGWTTQAVAGQVFPSPLGEVADVTLSDPRVKAAIIMSPSPPPGKTDPDKAFGPVKIPCLHMTGTKDDSVGITDTKPTDRRVPYDHMKLADQYLVIFKDGDHMIFAGARGKIGDGTKDPRFHDLIGLCTTAFWDAYLKGDARAKAWLSEKGFRQALGDDGTFEHKPGASK